MSKTFRGKYLDGVSRLLAEGDLDLPPQLEALRDAVHRQHWLRQCGKKSWVVYAQAPFAGPRKLVDYLGRYTHRTALGNQRIVRCEDGQVTFRYRDRADADREKSETLPVDEFLDRFLQHVLPSGFFRVRHYGLLANCVKRKLLPAPLPAVAGSSALSPAGRWPPHGGRVDAAPVGHRRDAVPLLWRRPGA